MSCLKKHCYVYLHRNSLFFGQKIQSSTLEMRWKQNLLFTNSNSFGHLKTMGDPVSQNLFIK